MRPIRSLSDGLFRSTACGCASGSSGVGNMNRNMIVTTRNAAAKNPSTRIGTLMTLLASYLSSSYPRRTATGSGSPRCDSSGLGSPGRPGASSETGSRPPAGGSVVLMVVTLRQTVRLGVGQQRPLLQLPHEEDTP